MKKKKRRIVGEYTQRLKDLELERFLNRKDKKENNNWPTKRKRKGRKSKRKNEKQKRKIKHAPISAWKAKYYAYLQSDEWAKIRIEILTDRKCCERCRSKKALKVHHKTYDNIFHEEPEDLELLCKDCHEKEHGIKK